jgi:hypothetical protein
MVAAMGAVMEEKMKWTAQVELLEVFPEVHHARWTEYVELLVQRHTHHSRMHHARLGTVQVELLEVFHEVHRARWME